MISWKPPTLAQPSDGYRHSADAFLLAGFAARYAPDFFCDLGTGSGVVAFALSHATGAAGVAVEREAPMYPYAQHNLKGLPLTVVRADLRFFPWAADCFDLVVCNPPYFSLGHGKISRNEGVARARHAFFGDVVAFGRALRRSLKPFGLFCFIFPFHSLPTVLDPMVSAGWHVRETMEVRSFADRTPRLICVALQREQPEQAEHGSLVMYHAHRMYTEEAVALLDPFQRKQPKKRPIHTVSS